ncbi:MAG: response regulator [Magnetococcus sp. MYC-9]
MSLLQTLSFKAKLAVLFLLIGVLPLLTSGWFALERADQELLEDAEERLARSLLFKKALLEQYLQMSVGQLQGMAGEQSLMHGIDFFRKRVLTHHEIDQTETIVWLDPQGIPISLDTHSEMDRQGVPLIAADFIPSANAKKGADGVVRWTHTESNTLRARLPLDLPGLRGSLAGTLPLREAMAPVRAMNHAMAIILLTTLLGVSLLAIGSGKMLLSPLRHMADAARRIADGEWSTRVPVTGTDEWGLVGLSFNRMAERVEQQYWVKENLARVSGLLQSVKGLDVLAQTMLRELLELLNAAHGAFYLLDKHTGRYVGSAAYRIQPWHTHPPSYALGEGIVGRCALERKIISFDGLPDSLWSIDSGLGTTQPVALLALPMNYQGQSKGVAIIASYYPFSPIQRQLLEELSLFGGIALDNLARMLHVEELLEETRNQSIELEMSQQELEQMNQELESTSHTLRLSEESLRNQKEALEQSNRVLEEQTQLLSNRNEQLEQTRVELEQTGRYKSEFLASMSHELRTPLNSILILAREFMKNEAGNLAADQVEAAEVIGQSGRELLEMINEILDLARIEAGQVETQIEEMLPELFAAEIRRQFAPQTREKGLAWQVILDEKLPETVSVDLAKIRRIVKNLVANAIQFTPQGGVTVRIDSAAAGQSLTTSLSIAVSDTGCGIAVGDQQAVFDAFRQLKRGDGIKQGGVGLGLSISRKLAERIGGAIHLDSEPGRGSTFTLLVPCEHPVRGSETPVLPTLPRADRSQGIPDDWLSESASLTGDPLAPSRKTRCLLLIEDDPLFAQSVHNLIGGRGFQVLIGNTGKAGLALAVHHQPNGILLDLGLPDMDGEEVLARLREDARTRHIPVHIVSGRDDPGEASRQRSVGFLSKPAEDADILQVLNRLVPFRAGNRRLLLVEDHAEMRKSVIELVQDLDVTVVEAANGAEALAHFGTGPFDCIVLDLGLPDMEGAQVLERMAGMGALPPVVIHSARDLTRQEHDRLQGYTDSIIIKSARLELRLREEIILFLNRVIRDNPEAIDTTTSQARHRDEYWNGKTVLLVDDDVRNLFSMTRNLEKKGLKVHMAGHGAEAIQMLETGQPVDIILMDIMMPVMDGYEAMRRIRAREPFRTLPILALTAKAMPEDRKKCLEAGADDYLSKPVDMDRLFEMMRIWVKKERLR